MIGIVGREDVFIEPECRFRVKERVVTEAGEAPRRQSDIIIGLWRDKMFRPEQLAAHPGWAAIPAVAWAMSMNQIPAHILAPVPRRGLPQWTRRFDAWVA